MSLGASANHVVQRVLASMKDAAQAMMCVRELVDVVPELVQRNRVGVVVALVDLCSRFKIEEKPVLKAVYSAMGIRDPAQDKSLVSKLLSGDVGDAGSRLLQALLRLDDCQSVVDSFLHTEGIADIACSKSGSRALESLLASPLLQARNRNRLVDQLAGEYVRLASNPYGSFCLEKLYLGTDLSRKKIIAGHLRDNYREISGTQHGAVVLGRVVFSRSCAAMV